MGARSTTLRRAGLALWLCALGAGCAREEPVGPAPPGPLLVVGVDGLEWDVALPLVQAGRMPNLRSLMERGTYGKLQTTRPTSSPILWTTIATGKDSAAHGIRGFVQDEGSGELELYDRTDRRTAAIWNMASEHGLRTACVGWWMTFPVEEILGVMVAQTNTEDHLPEGGTQRLWKGNLIDGVPGQVHPPERQNEMLAVLREVDASLPELLLRIFGAFPHELSALGEQLWSDCRWAFRADATYLEVTERLLGEADPFDLALVYFGGPDVVGHRFWRYLRPELYEHPPSTRELENLGHIVEDYYVYIDEALGRLVRAAGADATVFVLSDHGMNAVRRKEVFDAEAPPENVNSGHHAAAPPGVFLAAGPIVRAAERSLPSEVAQLETSGSIHDIAPTLLAALRIPLGRDLSGRVLTEIFRADFAIERQPRPVATHDTPAFLERQSFDGSTPGEAERLEQLRGLGYLDSEFQEDE